MPFAPLVGMEQLEATADVVRARLPFPDDLCTTGGLMHGGALMALADSCGAVCAFLNLPDGATGTTTVESKTNLLAAVREGTVTATAEPLKVGGTLIVVETTMRDAADRLVAKTAQTQAVLRGG